MNANEEVAKLWIWAAGTAARTEALQTIVTAIVPLVKDDPRFITALKAASDSIQSGHLNNPGISDDFIAKYHDHLVALTPPELRPQLR